MTRSNTPPTICTLAEVRAAQGRALDLIWRAMDELEGVGYRPDGELLLAIGDAAEVIDTGIATSPRW